MRIIPADQSHQEIRDFPPEDDSHHDANMLDDNEGEDTAPNTSAPNTSAPATSTFNTAPEQPPSPTPAEPIRFPFSQPQQGASSFTLSVPKPSYVENVKKWRLKFMAGKLGRSSLRRMRVTDLEAWCREFSVQVDAGLEGTPKARLEESLWNFVGLIIRRRTGAQPFHI